MYTARLRTTPSCKEPWVHEDSLAHFLEPLQSLYVPERQVLSTIPSLGALWCTEKTGTLLYIGRPKQFEYSCPW